VTNQAIEARAVGYDWLDKEEVQNGKSRAAGLGRLEKRTL